MDEYLIVSFLRIFVEFTSSFYDYAVSAKI